MRTSVKKLVIALAVLAGTGGNPARAEDIDLFSGISTSTTRPNVLVILDNSGAWNSNVSFNCPATVMTLPGGNVNTAGGFEQCALYNVLQGISTNTALLNNFNMGLMLFSTGSANGGTFYFPSTKAPSGLPAMDATGIAGFQSAVQALKVGGAGSNTANSSALGATMQEAWAFYTGQTGFSGTQYSSPLTDPCQKNFIIYIVNATNTGKAQDNTDNSVLNTLACTAGSLSSAGASCAGATTAQQTQIPLNPNYAKYQGNWADEWARFAYQTDVSTAFADNQNVVTYTIAVTDGSNPDYVEMLRSMAANGGGKTFLVKLGDMDALLQAILKILNEVQAVNSVFASASLPVSANAQGTFQNQIFMGMFRPDVQGQPRWMGNLKQFQFGIDTSSGSVELFMADATGAHALSSSGTGFISPNAISFWTSQDKTKLPDSNGGFWRNNVQGAGAGFDLPDGEVVEKGGVGEQIRLANLQDDYAANPTSPRNVYTYCPGGGTCSTLLSAAENLFATTNSGITATNLNASGNAVAISSISRTGTTATVTLASAPSPAVVAGQTITITGSNNGYNGSYTVATVPSSTTFTITVTEIPPNPATGAYLASIPSTSSTVTSLTRSTTSGTTAVAITSTAHGMVVGSQVTISGGSSGTFTTDPLYSPYYGTFTVTGTTSATEFEYAISEGPATPVDAPSGTATVGSTTYAMTYSTNATTPAQSIQRAASTLVSGAWTSTVTVTVMQAVASPFAAGAQVKIANTGTVYDGTWTITAVSNCPGGLKVAGKSRSFCFNMPTTPAMTNPAPSTAGAGITATPVSGSVVLSSLSWGTSNCPTSSVAKATAVTSTAHSFVSGQIVNIGGTPGVNENQYVGNFKISSINTPTAPSFTYNITTRPLCTDNSTTSPTMTATTSGITRDTLIRWVRGEDNFGDEASPGNPINIRPSVHGDVVHARPTVVNYGSTYGVVVFYGSGDGGFHAINGNQPAATPANIGSIPPGGELWSFVAPEFYSKLLRLHDNSPLIKYFSTPAGITPAPLPKDYFFDGIAGVYQHLDANLNTDKVYLYLSARRGGRMLYALDVTDPTNPKFLWKRTNADTGFSELGQTWSQPKVAVVKGYANPVLIFGAGYDPNEDSEPPIADTMGRGIFILDAFTGAIVWQAGPGGGSNSCSGTPCNLRDMTYATPADIALLDVTADGVVDRAYAADLGGNIWRLDFEPTGGNTPASWQVNLVAALGGASTDATKRKFFFAPDAVNTGSFTALMAVTGDREHPLHAMQATSVINRFYMIKDAKTGLDGSGTIPVVDDSSSTADNAPLNLFNSTTTPYNGSLSGFYVTLRHADTSGVTENGEKGVNAPVTVGGFTFFGTNTPIVPAANACNANLGTARSYQVGFLTGSVAYNTLQGGGLPPSPVAGLVNVNVDGTTATVPFIIGGSSPGCIGADCSSSIGAQKANIPIKQTRTRAYWYREVDR
jgi:type IV pilus assembly protein PilY1